MLPELLFGDLLGLYPSGIKRAHMSPMYVLALNAYLQQGFITHFGESRIKMSIASYFCSLWT